MRRHAGVTLIESLVALAIVAVLSAMVVPGFEQTLAQRRVVAAASDYVQALRLAQVEAIRRNRTVEVLFTGVDPVAANVLATPVASGAACCRLVRVAAPLGAADHVAGHGSSGHAGARVAIDAGAVRSVAFTPTGRPLDYTGAAPRPLAAPLVVRFTDVSSARRLCAVLSTAGSARLCDPRQANGAPMACPASLPAPC